MVKITSYNGKQLKISTDKRQVIVALIRIMAKALVNI